MSFQELCTKELISLASPMAFFFRKGLSWVVSENWFVVIAESGIPLFPDE